MKEDHRSYTRNFCSFEKKAWFEPLTSTIPVQSSHWLPMEQRIIFKLILTPQYLSSLLTLYAPKRSLRSATKNRRSIPRSNLSTYSYFEKGCRKKCTRQSRKVLWVVLSSLFFKEIWKNGRRGRGRMFVRAKGKQQKKFWQLQCQERCIDHIPDYLSGLSRARFCRQPFSK